MALYTYISIILSLSIIFKIRFNSFDDDFNHGRSSIIDI